MHFDEIAQKVYWENGEQKFKQLDTFKLFRAIYERKGDILSFADARKAISTQAKNGTACVLSRLRKELNYGFPFEIKTEAREGYRLITKRRI